MNEWSKLFTIEDFIGFFGNWSPEQEHLVNKALNTAYEEVLDACWQNDLEGDLENDLISEKDKKQISKATMILGAWILQNGYYEIGGAVSSSFAGKSVSQAISGNKELYNSFFNKLERTKYYTRTNTPTRQQTTSGVIVDGKYSLTTDLIGIKGLEYAYPEYEGKELNTILKDIKDVNWKGDKGDKGDQGIQGEQGFKGEQGDKGDKGDTGTLIIKKWYPTIDDMLDDTDPHYTDPKTGELVPLDFEEYVGIRTNPFLKVDEDEGKIYKWTYPGTWEYEIQIKGIQGEVGPIGPIGPQGPNGLPGNGIITNETRDIDVLPTNAFMLYSYSTLKSFDIGTEHFRITSVLSTPPISSSTPPSQTIYTIGDKKELRMFFRVFENGIWGEKKEIGGIPEIQINREVLFEVYNQGQFFPPLPLSKGIDNFDLIMITTFNNSTTSTSSGGTTIIRSADLIKSIGLSNGGRQALNGDLAREISARSLTILAFGGGSPSNDWDIIIEGIK